MKDILTKVQNNKTEEQNIEETNSKTKIKTEMKVV